MGPWNSTGILTVPGFMPNNYGPPDSTGVLTVPGFLLPLVELILGQN
jgi:hypothetical protein